jgi:hypothetical protein
VSDPSGRAGRATRIRELATITGVIAFGMLILIGGRSGAVTIGVGAWMIALAVLLQIGRVLRDREASGAGPGGRIATRTLDGEPATVLHEHPARHLLGAALAALATAPFVALPLSAVPWDAGSTDDDVIGVIVVLSALVVPVALVVGGQLRRALRAGVWLTPSALVVRERDLTSTVRWSDVWRVRDVDGPASTVWVVVRDEEAVTLVTRRRRDRRFRSGLRGVPIPTGMYALAAPELVELLRACQDRAVAAQLGSDAGLALVRGARRFAPFTEHGGR